MDINKLDKWAELLLDLGKRNNLVNFKDSKSGTVEVIAPDVASLFNKVNEGVSFEVYDPKIDDEFDDENPEEQGTTVPKALSKEEYYNLYCNKLRKSSQILIYNQFINPIKALKNVQKKAKQAIEEAGVNIVYLAFGFILWKEREESETIFRAPILLVPISITNASSVDPYFVNITDDDVIVNPTFEYKLQNEYGISIPDYNDEKIGDYIDSIGAIVSKLKWTVSSECKIGIFSFQKINMYRDLKDNKHLIAKNGTIQNIIGSDVQETPTATDTSNGQEASDLLYLHNVVDADSSQAEAINLAKEGRSFVLQGPPGTGKSQTITNIIAECLSEGKKVLFVSEKLAALNVVFNKLKAVNLSEFCLELHSYKANKKAVIEELCHTLRLGKSAVASRAGAEISIKKKNQKILDDYEEELHRIRPVINKSLFQLYGLLASCRKTTILKYGINGIETKGEEYADEITSLLEQYEKYIPQIGYDYHNNVWYGYNNYDTSFKNKLRIETDFTSVLKFIAETEEINGTLQTDLGITCFCIRSLSQCIDLLSVLKSSQYITPILLNPKQNEEALTTLEKMSVLAQKIITNKQKAEETFEASIYKLDGEGYHKILSKRYNKFSSRLFGKQYKQIISELRLCKSDGKRISYKKALLALELLSTIQEDVSSFETLENQVIHMLGKGYKGVDTVWEDLMTEYVKISNILKQGFRCDYLASLSNEDFINCQALMQNHYCVLTALLNRYMDIFIRINQDFDSNCFDIYSCNLIDLKNKFEGCLKTMDRVENWCRFCILVESLDKLDGKSYIDYSIENKVSPNEIAIVYKKTFYNQWIDYIIQNSKVLLDFSRMSHDKAVELFSQKDELQFEINKADIKAMLSSNRPSLDLVAGGSAISMLLREGEKKRKQKNIRKLLSEIGELVQVLKPCFLMSPLSVSTFLPAEKISFDTVIFDEASQIFPQDAVGAIYRGKQLIVVGDSKQMPPSNFFGTSIDDNEEDEEESISDFESILDLCSISLPQQRLKWHYRSRYEQLISFSNKNFYDNSLVTFPSSRMDEKWIGVDYYYSDGIFDHKSRTNIIEAEFVVDLICKNIEKFPDRSLGVVAFSISQQDLIERILAKRRQKNPLNEQFFAEDKIEPFFIKNLETVQGDERDTIIFSVAYGKDSQGRLLHNFGPLNKSGGERRLNVAITRAKMNVQLVSSMHNYDIDLSKTQSVGAKLLRDYLDYAENGYRALDSTISVNPFEQFDSDFESEVCDYLREHGYSVDTQIGCSIFKIDLGLKLPNSSNYVLAVECDGASYHSFKNTRDRDRLRREILERMGWRFYRIWSTDWYKNNTAEKEKLLEVVEDAIAKCGNPLPKPAEICETFVEEQPISHFTFPEYEMVDVEAVARSVKYDTLKLVKAVMNVEQPIAEEWLLKRICFIYDREKVTSVVRSEYNFKMENCSSAGIIRKDGFLYLKEKEIPMLRVPIESDKPRDIQYISIEELSKGLYELLAHNISADKEGLFRTLAQQLGYSRMGDGIHDRLEMALQAISNMIATDGEILSIKK